MIDVLKNYRAICLVSNNELLISKSRAIYLYNIDINKFEYIASFCFSLKLLLINVILILKRLFRLDISASVMLDGESVLFVFNSYFYKLNIKTKILSRCMPVSKGSRPLNVININGVHGFETGIYYGEYFDNIDRGHVHIKRILLSEVEEIVYTFPSNTIYHIHHLLPDKDNNCVWIFTGDLDSESGIWKATDNFRRVEPVMVGKQLYRACVAFAVPEGILYATDSPDETNYICLLYKEGEEYKVRKIQEIAGPVIYGTRYKDKYCFSTTVEPAIIKKYSKKEYLRYLFTMKKGKGVKDYKSHLYMGNLQEGFADIYSARKDFLPMGLFQFGAIIFPNTNGFNPDKLVFYQMATLKNNMDTLILDI